MLAEIMQRHRVKHDKFLALRIFAHALSERLLRLGVPTQRAVGAAQAKQGSGTVLIVERTAQRLFLIRDGLPFPPEIVMRPSELA